MTQPTPPPQTVGIPVDKFAVDSAAGNLARAIEQWYPGVQKMQQYLLAAPEADLEAPPFNYSPENIAVLKSAFNDLSLLVEIYLGTATLDTARDLGTFSRRLAGLVV
jgi:hypothetical protein